MDDSDRVIPAAARLQSRWTKVVIVFGFFAFVGAGCLKGSAGPIELEKKVVEKKVVADQKKYTLLSRACITQNFELEKGEREQAQLNWQNSEFYRYFSEQAGVQFMPDFNDAIQQKLDQGWRFSVACTELGGGGPALYFAMYNPAAGEVLWIDKKQKGQSNLIGEYSPRHEEASFIHFSEPIGIPNINGYPYHGFMHYLGRASDGLIIAKAYRDTGGEQFVDVYQLDELDATAGMSSINLTGKLKLISTHWTQ